jgi:hypothetical protein
MDRTRDVRLGGPSTNSQRRSPRQQARDAPRDSPRAEGRLNRLIVDLNFAIQEFDPKDKTTSI